MNNNFNDNERTAEPLMIDKQRNDTWTKHLMCLYLFCGSATPQTHLYTYPYLCLVSLSSGSLYRLFIDSCLFILLDTAQNLASLDVNK